MKKLHLPRIQIVQAAFNIYAAEGPKGLTMRKIGAAIGVRASALYKHFRNKDAIVDAVAAEADRALALRLRAPPKQKPEEGRTRPLLGRALEYAVEQPRLFRLAASHRPRWDQPSAEARGVVQAEVEKGMKSGELRIGDVRARSVALWSQLCGLAAVRERGDLPAEPHDLRSAWFSASWPVLEGLSRTAA